MYSTSHKDTHPIALLVDDDKEIHDYVSTMLGCLDFKVEIAASGEEMLTRLSENKPDIILLDVYLFDVSGLELAKNLCGDERYRDIPVLILTSDTSSEVVNEAYSYNVYDFVEKPINLSLLVNRIQTALKHNRLDSKVKNQESRLQQLQYIAGMGYWEYDSEFELFECSAGLYEMLGIPESRSFNLYSFLAQTHEDDVEQVSDTINTAIRNATPYALEHRIYDNDGDETIVLHQGMVFKKENGKFFKILSTITDITERRQTQELIAFNSLHDKLTGLPNRSHFCDSLGNLMIVNDKNEKLLAVIFVGIDRFKNINESLGHTVGDELLINITDRLAEIDEDLFVARFSGDVFAIAIGNLNSIEKAVYAATDIQKELSLPYNVLGNDVYITVSIGVSVYPLYYGGKDQLISHAETAMHFSKNSGGNRISCFDRNMNKTGRRRLFIETDLRKAIDKEQFELFYQPQVSVQNRRLIGMEALIRWRHPEYGLIMPDKFVQIAEETGLILPIGQWVLETATRQVAKWINEGYGLLRVGVNISPLQFSDNNLVKHIEDTLSKTNLLPCSLDIEMTESSAMRDVKQTIAILNQFREMGVQTSLDDFGTGYSSLSYLKMMPLHTLKIDRAFIKDINKYGVNGEIAEMIISMCHTLGMNVIAEGVETEEHMKFLLKHECIEAQGYLFSPPIEAEKFEKILTSFTGTDSKKSIEYEKPDTDFLIF